MTVCTIARWWFVWERERGRIWVWPTQLRTVNSWFVWMRTREELSLTDSVTENHDSQLPETWLNERTNKQFRRLFLANWPMQIDSFKWIMKFTTSNENGSVCVCVCVSGQARRASGSECQFSEVMNKSGCVCANVYYKVSETKKLRIKIFKKLRIKYPACQESVVTSFWPYSNYKQTHCRYPRENISPGQNVSLVLLDSRKGVT